LEEEVSIDETEEEIIDDFLSYWVDLDQLDNVNSCIFVVDNFDVVTGAEEDAQSCEAVTSVERSLSGDKYSEEESSDAFTIIVQEEVHMNEKEIQLEELVYEPTVKVVETCSFQTDKLCMNAGMIHNDDQLFLLSDGQITEFIAGVEN